MTTRKHPSKARRSRGRSVAGTERGHDARPSAAAMSDAIEDERLRLMKAHSVLNCVAVAMEAEVTDTEEPYYPALIEVASDLVNESIRRLDSVVLRNQAAQLELARTQAAQDENGEEEMPASLGVREPRSVYCVSSVPVPGYQILH